MGGGRLTPPLGKTAILAPKSNDNELKKIYLSQFILKFHKIKKKLDFSRPPPLARAAYKST